MSQPTTADDTRQPAYDAVYAYIRRLGDRMPTSRVDRNAIIWHGVNAALDARPAEAPAEDAQRTARRASIRNLLDRASRGILIGGTEGELLRQQVEAEMRLSDQAHQRWEGLEAAERYRQAAEDTFHGRLAAIQQQTAEGLVEGFEELQQRAERAEAAIERVRAVGPQLEYDATAPGLAEPAREVLRDASRRIRAALDGTEQQQDQPTETRVSYFIQSRPAPNQPWQQTGVRWSWQSKAKALEKLAARREMQPNLEHRLMTRTTTVTEQPTDPA